MIIQAYPSSEFGGQEFNENEKIAEFVSARGFTGPNAMLMDKVKVNGGDSSPVFKFLKNRVGQVLVGVFRADSLSLSHAQTLLTRSFDHSIIRSFARQPIKWNFDGKYLVRKDGTTVTRYGSTQSPLSFEADIKAALNE